MFSLDGVGVESMQWLTGFVQNEIGDVYNIVDGPLTDGLQFILQPLRTFINSNIRNSNAAITLAGIGIFNRNPDRILVIVDSKIVVERRFHRLGRGGARQHPSLL